MQRLLLLTCLAANCAGAASTAPASTPTPALAPATASAPALAATAAPVPFDSHVSVLSGEQVIQILDDTVDWYRTLGTQQQNATQPSDLLILFANRQTADKVVGLAFEIARANAELLSSEANAGASAADPSSSQALDQQQSQLTARRQALQQEISTSHGAAAAKLPELQGELAMVDARKNLLDTMSEFVSESDPKGAGANALKQHIDAIAASLPTSSTASSAAAAGGPTTAAGSGSVATNGTATAVETSKAPPSRYGIWDLGAGVLQLRNKISSIDGINRHTSELAQTFAKISAAPLKQLKAYSARSDALASQSKLAGGAALKSLRDEFDTLAWLFKQTSAILIPLTEEQVLLQQYRHNLGNWADATRRQYRDACATLGIRVGILIGVLAAVFALAELWKRAVVRYAQEQRRRYQLLLVRKIVMWSVIIAILGLSFVTEISALATFAGLLTAGVAVAMQSVLVSVVGYFFLIGKYGIRVGDRIQIGTVVGEVIELGLVRMHLMELNTQGPLGPTGRVVAFANLIVFQTSGGLFKQIPGVNLTWHETTLTLPEVGDYAGLKDRLLASVTGVLVGYRDEITRQTSEIKRTTASLSIGDAAPHVQMHIEDGRMEAAIRYPVSLEHASEIEERVSEALWKVIATMKT